MSNTKTNTNTKTNLNTNTNTNTNPKTNRNISTNTNPKTNRNISTNIISNKLRKEFIFSNKQRDKLKDIDNELIGVLQSNELKKFKYLNDKNIKTDIDLENKNIIELILHFLQNITIFYEEVERSTNSKQSIDAFKEICIEVEKMNSNNITLCSKIFTNKLSWSQLTQFKELYDTVIEMIDLVITIKTYKNCKDCSNKELILPKNYIYLAKLLQILKIRINTYIENIREWIEESYKEDNQQKKENYLYNLVWANKLNYLLKSDTLKMSVSISKNNTNIKKSEFIENTYININRLTDYFTDLPLISKLYTLNEVNKYNNNDDNFKNSSKSQNKNKTTGGAKKQRKQRKKRKSKK